MTHYNSIIDLYTFALNPDQTYAVYVDRVRYELICYFLHPLQKKEAAGKIFADWDILPEPKIKDPDAEKPDDWVDHPRMIGKGSTIEISLLTNIPTYL